MHWLIPNISTNHHTHVQWDHMPNIQNINIKETSHAMGLMHIGVSSKFKILQTPFILIEQSSQTL